MTRTIPALITLLFAALAAAQAANQTASP